MPCDISKKENTQLINIFTYYEFPMEEFESCFEVRAMVCAVFAADHWSS